MIGFSQEESQIRKEIDSLLHINKTANDPNLLIEICKLFRNNNVDSAIFYAEKAIDLAEKRNLDYERAMAYAALAANYRYLENGFDNTVKYFKIAGEIFKEIKDEEKEARIYNNIGIEYDYTGDYSTALKYYIKALKKYEKIGFKQGQSEATNNIGLMYELMGDVENAIINYQISSDLAYEIGDSLGWSMSIANLAAMNYKQEDFDKAIELFNQAIEIRKSIGQEKTLNQVYNNLAALYYDIGDTLKSIELMEKTLDLNIQKNAYKSTAVNYYNIGFIYHDLKNYDKAKDYYLNALKIATEFHYYDQERDYQTALSNLYADISDFESAFNALLRYIEINDTLFNEEKERASLELKEAFESEKKDITIAKQNADIATEAAINSRNKILLLLSGGILVIVIGFSVVLFTRIKKIKQQKKKIEEQKKEEYLQKIELKEKNKEILDSIQYAKRIQAAILPPIKLVKEHLESSFVLYIPKDIVAGDFYWMEAVSNAASRQMKHSAKKSEIASDSSVHSNKSITKQDQSTILYAAADCTGHGVPGAMVSVVCHNAMNRAVREFQLTKPSEILDKTREIVLQEFEKSEEEVKDGMDIALCSLRFDVQGSKLKKTTSTKNPSTSNFKPQTKAKLNYAGANNPLWIIRNGEIIEIKADKQPIGKFDHAKPFTNHVIPLFENDIIYIFSDGYVDQFGGIKGKKFKSKAFRELLLSIESESMDAQKEIIHQTFESWRGDIEQIDDVCVIGVRV